MRALRLLPIALVLVGCETTATVTGRTDDGEVFTGTAVATGTWEAAGTIHIVSNRGLTCIGRYRYEGLVGPRGKANYSCSNGDTGEADLVARTPASGDGQGTIGSRRITFTFAN